MDYRELLIKHMLCCMGCEGRVCMLGADDPESGYTDNAKLGISPEEYAELTALAEIAYERDRQRRGVRLTPEQMRECARIGEPIIAETWQSAWQSAFKKLTDERDSKD